MSSPAVPLWLGWSDHYWDVQCSPNCWYTLLDTALQDTQIAGYLVWPILAGFGINSRRSDRVCNSCPSPSKYEGSRSITFRPGVAKAVLGTGLLFLYWQMNFFSSMYLKLKLFYRQLLLTSTFCILKWYFQCSSYSDVKCRVGRGVGLVKKWV